MHKNFKLVLYILLTLSITVFMWGVINIFFLQKLPISYIDIQKPTNFYNIHIDKLFTNRAIIKKTTKKEILKGITLKAIFENGKDSFVIIKDKKEIFLDLNQKYKGYKLIKVTKNSAIFTKNNKEFEIKFKKEPFKNYIQKNQTQYQQEITKETIKQYTSNPAKIWKNIGIIHTKKGYKVTYVKPNSIIAKLGLKKGDILLEVNNQKLLTDKDAWNIYKHINDFDEVNIKIKRNNQIKELTYEIY